MAYVPNPIDPTQPADTVTVDTAAAEFRALKRYIQTQLTALRASVWQTGDIRLALSPTVPAGWLRIPVIATTISRVTYPELTAWIVALGSPWGIGDGTTTIGMPFIPEGYAIGNTAIAALGTRTPGALAAHTHPFVAVQFIGGVGYSSTVYAGNQIQPVAGVTGSTGGVGNLAALTYTAFLIKT